MKKNRKKSPPHIATWIISRLSIYEKEHALADAIEAEYFDIQARLGIFLSWIWYWFCTIGILFYYMKFSLVWSMIMFKNYLKVALRNLKKHKGYSIINISGFAIGMAVCLLILIYIRQELSYDKYHKDEERVYRIILDSRTQTAKRVFAPITAMVAPTLKSDYNQVEQAVRSLITSSRLVRREDKYFYEERFMYADPELFDVLTIPFIQGNSQKALTRPRTLVISERMSLKYFGHSNPIGETIEINNETFEITGIVVNSPENTHLKYDLIASMETLNGWEELTNWYSTMFYTYLKLRPNVNVEEFSQQVSNLADKYVGEKLKEWGNTDRYFLQPISSIHLHSHIRYETEPSGNPLYITIFSFVGLFILLIACLNFMNLSTARSANRAKEVGMRKVVGAKRSQLISQFLGESLFVSLISLGFSMAMAKFAIPVINNVTGIALDFNQLLNPVILISLIAGSILVGLAAGVYPALVLSAFRPIATLKGSLSSGSRGFTMRNVLVVVQFSISVVLIVGTLIMARQLNFMKNQHLGFQKEQKLVIPIRGGISIQENYETVKDLFSKHPSISDASVSSTVPGRGVSNFGVSLVGAEDRKNQSMFHMYFDHDFVPDYGIEMVAGRAFQKDMSTDIAGAFLINEAAVTAFGWSSPDEALGKRLQTGFGGRVNPIIGVTKNFHYRGLQTNVEPLVMEFLPEMFRYITLSLDISNLNETLAFIESQWKSMYPNNPFENFFLDTYFDLQYRSDEQVGRIFGIFTILGLFIACLGLLGLASFTAESRTKEIGIRKVLGASVPCIVTMLTKQFTKWVLLANCLAWPVAYYIMRRWLKNFAYRTDIDLFIFVLSGLLVLGVALLTVSFQSIRAATINPAESLRYE
jgi:putative ABC transport system permease protein